MQVVPYFFKKFILICVVIGIVVSLIAYLYYQTKQSYWAVGWNDGSIETNLKLLHIIRDSSGKIHDCKDIDNSIERIEILRVKTEFLYLVKHKDGRFDFCQ